MSDIGRRLFVTVLGSGAFVWFDKNYQSGGNTGGNVSNPDQVDIQLEGAVLEVVQDDATTDATVTVDLDTVNYGTQDGSVFVEFRDQVEEIETRDVAVAAGELQPLTFSQVYTDVTESDVTLDVTNQPPQVKLTLPRPNIQFTGGQITDGSGNVITEIQEGQTFYVSGTAENVGERQGTKEYVLFGDSAQLGSTTVDLQPGGSTGIEFSHTFQSGDLDLASGESKPVNLSVNETDVGEISIFKPAIPDISVSRTSDNSSLTVSGERGLLIDFDDVWPDFQGRLSSMTSNVTKAYMYRRSDNTLIASKDISGLSAGDVVTMSDVDLQPYDGTEATQYRFLADAEGSDFTVGYYDSTSFPVSSQNGSLRIQAGAGLSGTSNSDSYIWSEIGNINL